MEDFDKIFEAAPDTDDFDKIFEEAPEVQKTPKRSILQKGLDIGSDIVESGVELAKEYTPPAIEEAGRVALGGAQGLTLGFADEIAAKANQLLDPIISKLSGEEAINEALAKQGFQVEQPETSYDQELERTRAMYKEAQKESPYLYGAGYIGGALASGQALGGGLSLATKGTKLGQLAEASRLGRIAKSATEAGIGMGIESYGESEGKTLDEILSDIKEGSIIGAVAGGGTQAVSDVAVPAVKKIAEPVTKMVGEYVEDSPFLRQIKKSFEKYGMEYGVSPRSEKAIQKGVEGVEGGTPFSQLDLKRTKEIVGTLEKNREILGENVKKSIEDNINLKIDMRAAAQEFGESFNKIAEDLPSIVRDPKVIDILETLNKKNYGALNPKETKSTIDQVSKIIDRIESSKYGSMELEETAKLLKDFRKNLDTTLKDSVPAYKKAASQYTSFMQSAFEQPIMGKYDTELSDLFYSNLKDDKLKLTKAYENLIEGTSDISSRDVQTTFSNISEALSKLEKEGVPINFESREFLKKLKDYSDDAAIRRAVVKTQESQGGASKAVGLMTGLGETGKAWSYLGAQRTGQYIGKPIKKVFEMPRNQLSGLASKLEAVPSVDFLGKALRESVESGDNFRKNAILYSIMQNPSAKLLIDSEDEMEE